ncbi:endoribonuclease Dicer homolog 3b-like [Typha latifolia]|uniref:endoribonuclease Dicer homolog 3b-like n=1 Tax=Typha latifolia TaxID=4733 RepID=UPI003C2B936C
MERPPPRRKPKDFEPRSYQVEVFKGAMQWNTIVVLETGAGKTMIAVMLMKEIRNSLRERESGKSMLIVFLASTVHLVNQELACGVLNPESWEKEISSREIVVMTPQILLDALSHAFMT